MSSDDSAPQPIGFYGHRSDHYASRKQQAHTAGLGGEILDTTAGTHSVTRNYLTGY